MDKRLLVAGAALLALLLGAAAPIAAIAMMVMSLMGVQAANASGPCGPQGAGGDGVVVPSGPVRLPLAGKFTVTSEYGMRFHPVLHTPKLHAGIDFATIPVNGPVLAAKAGVVRSAAAAGAAGNLLVIDHGGGVATRYMHLTRFLVKAGDTVVAGQQVGVEGTTGRSTGPHLHFEVVINGKATDPRPWLTQQGVVVPPTRGTAVAPPAVAPGAPAAPGATTSTTTAATVSSSPAPSLSFTLLPGDPLVTPSGTASPVTGSLPAAVGIWRGEQVVNAARIIKAAQARGVGVWETTLAVNVAMSESSLENVDHGDAARGDTIGLFQEGPERGPYEVRMDPAGAAGIFLDYLLKVPGYRSLAPTIAAHKAQANADPYHYDPQWNDAVTMVATLTADPELLKSLPAGSGAAAPCAPGSGTSDLPPAPGSLPGLDGGPCPATTSPAEKGLHSTALRVMRCGAKAFPVIKTFYGTGGRPGPSDHPAGKAIDFMIEDYRSPTGRAYGWQVANWMRAHAQDLGIKYVIFDVKIWSPQRDGEGWRPYEHYLGNTDDTLAHRDHVHVSVN